MEEYTVKSKNLKRSVPAPPFASFDSHGGEVGHTVLLAPTGTGMAVSMRELLTPVERAALDGWISTQQSDISGLIDMMLWPGWAEWAKRKVCNPESWSW